MVKVTLYPWAGRMGPLSIRSHCAECELTLGLLEGIRSRELAGAAIDVEVKPWLSHLWEALAAGGWHPPVLVIDGRRFSQGVVPMRAALLQRLRLRLAARGYQPILHPDGVQPAKGAKEKVSHAQVAHLGA